MLDMMVAVTSVLAVLVPNMVGYKELDHFLLFHILLLRPPCLSTYFAKIVHIFLLKEVSNLMQGALVQAFHTTDREDCL